MMKNLKIRKAQKQEYKIYWNKAECFYEAMVNSYQNNLWPSVGLMAVHCTISLCDALLVKTSGIRSIGDGHNQAVELLTREKIGGIDKQITTVKRIIAKKNVIAYEGREFRKTEADEIYQHAERFYQWATNYLVKSEG